MVSACIPQVFRNNWSTSKKPDIPKLSLTCPADAEHEHAEQCSIR